MGNVIVAFLAWGLFVGWISFITTRMIYSAKMPDMIKEATSEKMKDIEFENSFLNKKLNLKTIQYNTLVKNVNEVLSDDRKSMKDLIKKLDG